MQMVIDIPEDIYNHTQAYEIGGFNQENDARVFDLIKHGIPLPKGHGGLIDADELILQIAELSGDILNPCYGVTYSDIKNAHVIIKADKEEEK